MPCTSFPIGPGDTHLFGLNGIVPSNKETLLGHSASTWYTLTLEKTKVQQGFD